MITMTHSASGSGLSRNSWSFELWPFMSKHPNVKRQLEQLTLKARRYFAVVGAILSLYLVDTGPAALNQSGGRGYIGLRVDLEFVRV